jgi:hypothetical protein
MIIKALDDPASARLNVLAKPGCVVMAGLPSVSPLLELRDLLLAGSRKICLMLLETADDPASARLHPAAEL